MWCPVLYHVTHSYFWGRHASRKILCHAQVKAARFFFLLKNSARNFFLTRNICSIFLGGFAHPPIKNQMVHPLRTCVQTISFKSEICFCRSAMFTSLCTMFFAECVSLRGFLVTCFCFRAAKAALALSFFSCIWSFRLWKRVSALIKLCSIWRDASRGCWS